MKNNLVRKEVTLVIFFLLLSINIVSLESALQQDTQKLNNQQIVEDYNKYTAFSENSNRDFISSSWWDIEWKYRKMITIDHNNIENDLTNFPVLISDISLDYINHAQTDGDDFIFIDRTNSIQYNHEIEEYNSLTGELIAWVNVTSLNSNEDPILYLYYGNQVCGNQENILETWDSNYAGVWHLSENISDASFSFLDKVVSFGGYTETNPIIECGSDNTSYDQYIREIGNTWFDEGDIGSEYRIVYSAYNNTTGIQYNKSHNNHVRVAWANSSDGKNWIKQGLINDTFPFEDPYITKVNEVWYLYGENKTDNNTKDISLFTSQDFSNWIYQDKVLINGSAGDWDGDAVSSPLLWYENGIWYLFYEGIEWDNGYEGGQIGLATSTDGIHFVKNLTKPVFSPDEIDWALQCIPDDMIKVDDVYYLFYHGQEPTEGFRTGIATSTNLVNWTDSGKWYQDDSSVTTDSGGAQITWNGKEYIIWYSGSRDEIGIKRGYLLNKCPDSTIKTNNGVPISVLLNKSSKINNGKNFFPDLLSHIDVEKNSSLILTDNITIEGWIKSPESIAYRGVLSKKSAEDWGLKGYSINLDDAGRIIFSLNDKKATSSWGKKYDDNQWHYVVCNWMKGENLKIYVDGDEVDYSLQQNLSDDILNSDTNLKIGFYHMNGFFNGTLDEIRVSNNRRNIDWIKTSFQNQNDTGTFMEFGNQEYFNQPPFNPYEPTGPDSGKINVEYVFSAVSIDPNENQIYYLFDWGDDSSPVWIGPFDSGDEIVIHHAWEEEGEYEIKVRAKDIYNASSNWSYPHVISIFSPELEIGDINGGIGKVSVDIQNIGVVDVENVEWKISVEGGFLRDISFETDNVIVGLDPSDVITVRVDQFIHGFGRVEITVSAYNENLGEITKKVDGFVFFLFVRVK